ncbi:AGE family epimerase/isomerase [Nocardioides sp.]|uniref:AGE family epimerase/isomerase n=1 Tax=Nocardioides sp. TaxID=35761 RepID=UPI00286B252B|nr:AGE family epimerase/isomerase [Nocardioides sp.]
MVTSARPAPGSPAYLAEQRADLLRFAAGSRQELGFGYLDSHGVVDPARPVELWITCRMTHVACLGLLADEPPAEGGPGPAELAALAAHGVAALATSLADEEHGGWFAAVGPGGVVDDTKQAYGHAFVVLAASSATVAGIDGAPALLERALVVLDERFWDDAEGLVVDAWDRAWSRLDDYRGVNANMHTVEALLAAGDVTGDSTLHRRAARIAARVVAWAQDNAWRIPEHFTPTWEPLLEHHREVPAHPFQPYGATVGHGLEWARLLVAVDRTLDDDAPVGLVAAAVALADRAVADGWASDGEDGFVYTTDWSGVPVVRARMHWVAAEAVSTAVVLHRVTGEERWREAGERWWTYVDRHLVDHEHGSWIHELDELNRPSDRTWPGKPDVYHAYQAALLPCLPTVPSFASALRSLGP